MTPLEMDARVQADMLGNLHIYRSTASSEPGEVQAKEGDSERAAVSRSEASPPAQQQKIGTGRDVKSLIFRSNRIDIGPGIYLRQPGLFRVAHGSFSLQYDALPEYQVGLLVFEFPAVSAISERLQQGKLKSRFASATAPRMDGPRQGVFNLTNGAIRIVDVISATYRPLTLMLKELLKDALFRDMLQALSDAMKKEEDTWASKKHFDLPFYNDVTRPALDRLLKGGG